MDVNELQSIAKSIDDTSLGRCLAILATLAERGLEASDNSAGEPEPAEDPLWTPAKASSYLDVSTATLRKYRKRYEMESVGSGKSRRYRKSEIERVICLRSQA